MKKTFWILSVSIIGIIIAVFIFTNNKSPIEKPNVSSITDLPNIESQEQLVNLLKERTKQSPFEITEESTTLSSDLAGEAESSDSANSSETNVQVAGIDEGDIIKTDGEYIYFARESDIIIASLENQNSKVVTTIEEDEYYPRELYLQDNLLISIGYHFETIRDKDAVNDSSTESQVEIYPIPTELTTVFIYDISDPKHPKMVRELAIEGSLHASRKMDGYLYLVANQYPPYKIMESPDTELRPFVKDSSKGETGEAISFDDMYFFPESNETNYLTIASINLNDLEKEANIETYLGASNEMYMSKNNLYLATKKYKNEDRSPSNKAEVMIARPSSADTEIFQFHIGNGAITFNTSTIVNGTLINQFAMDEREDTFRVATTIGTAWEEDEPTTNNLYTFDMNLNPLGSLEGLARGEQIYSVRFMNDVAYMVTFEQVDPLFVIDLKDPKKPTVLGELKIPGFSNYLHPLDDTYLIGFGQNTKLVENEWSKEPFVQNDGLKISLFDVSDPTNPIEKDNEIIGRGGSYSELNYNHKVLYQHPDKNLFGFPAVLYETKIVQQGDATYEDQSFVYEGAFLYNITPKEGIVLNDTITHQQETQMNYPEWESEIKRIISVDDNTIYTFSLNQFNVYNLDSNSIIKEVELPALSTVH